MKAAVYKGNGLPLELETLDDPKPAKGEVILKIHRCGICGSDLHMTDGHMFDLPIGTIPGHEYSGEIIELGTGVEGLKVGDLITACPSNGCGRIDCVGCQSGNLVMCKNPTDTGSVMGGFGEYLKVPSHLAIKLPDTLSLEDGALVEPLAVGLYGVRMANIQPGDRVVVMGAGSVALCTIYWAKRLGAGKIVAMSRSKRREALALQMGADTFIQYGDNELAEVAASLGGAADIVFECIGAAGFLDKAIQHVRTLGKVLSMGFCMAPDSFIPAIAGFKGVSLQFPVGYSLKDFEYTANVMDKGHVDPKVLVSSVIGLDELPTKFAELKGANQETKVQVKMA